MLNFEGHITFAAVGALSVPLFEQILADFVAGERALLVLDATDFGVFQQLHIEFDPFKRDAGERQPARQADAPVQDVIEAAGQTGWQPARSTTSIVETRWAIAGMAST